MPKFIYTAKSFDGKTKGGQMDAKDEKALAQELRAEGFLVTSVKQLGDSSKSSGGNFLERFSTVPLKEKMVFARNLSVMISSGLPISRAITNLCSQTKNKRFRGILSDINNDLQKGKNLSDGLKKYPRVFNDLFVNMVRVGEAGGTLENSLEIIANQLEKDHDLISKVRGAMMYPAVILVVMFGIGIIMLTFVFPKMLGVFKDMNVQLPLATRVVISLSDFLKNHSIIVVVMFIGTIVFIKLFSGTNPGKKFFSFLAINIPILSNIIIKVNCARFAGIYSSLLRSGVSVIEALKILHNTLGNYFYKKAMEDSIEKVQKGVNLSEVIGAYPKIFPVLVPQMIQVGEETGKIEAVLSKLSEFYEAEVAQITKNMSSIIEPVLMVLIGGAVGVFAIAMLQPMYSLMENIK